MTYTVQGSNHPNASQHPPTAEAVASWATIFDGPIYSDGAARGYALEVSRRYRFVRVFTHRRGGLGHVFYAVVDGREV